MRMESPLTLLVIVAGILLFGGITGNAQIIGRSRFERFQKSAIGSTMEEVRKTLGKPKSIDHGTPQLIRSDGTYIMHRVNATITWFYITGTDKEGNAYLMYVVFDNSKTVIETDVSRYDPNSPPRHY